MSSKNSNEELQSRREFFKKAAKAALPVVGAVVLSSLPISVNASETGCGYTCSNSCYTGCSTSCGYGCSGSCKGGCGGCKGVCRSSCSGNAFY